MAMHTLTTIMFYDRWNETIVANEELLEKMHFRHLGNLINSNSWLPEKTRTRSENTNPRVGTPIEQDGNPTSGIQGSRDTFLYS